MRSLARSAAAAAVVAVLVAVPAAADVRVAFIDPLSGGAATTGILAQKTHQFYIDAINAAGGINGEKIELVSFDNKVNPQESLIQLKKALDEGARYVVQGNGSSIAHAITEAVLKHNERNPGKEVLFLNYAAIDPVLTNEECNFWHFRFDADADMKMAAMTDVIAKDPKIKKVYLINQDYSFGKAVAAAATRMLAEKRPDIKIVGDELHPLQKVQDFSPYVAKIRASGADTVITGNWSNDMVLLVKAGKDAGLKVGWETFYGGSPGTVTAIGEAGVDTLKQVTEWHKNAAPELDATVAAFGKRYPGQGKRIRVLARQDHVGNVRRRGEEGAVERSGQGRQSARGHEDVDAARRSRDARGQPPVAATAVCVDVVEGREIRRRGFRPRLEKRRQGRCQGNRVADDVQDGTAEVSCGRFRVGRRTRWRPAPSPIIGGSVRPHHSV